MDWFDVGYKPEYDPAKIDKNVKILRNTVEKNNIKFTQELDLIDGKFDQTLSVDGAVSLFRQEARKFTFEADQINFEGHVFGENASFSGELRGASGTFSGNLSGAEITGSTFTQDTAKSNITLDDTGLTITDKTHGDKIYMGLADLGGFEGNDKGLYFLDNDGKLEGGISTYYTDMYISTDLGLTIQAGGAYGIQIDGRESLGALSAGTRIRGGLIVSGGTRSSADFQVNTNGTLESLRTYENTSGSTVNMRVGDNGRFYRISSARKYKMDIQDADYDCKKVYNLRPRMWHDKPEYERNGKSTDGLDWYYGLVAEEVVEAGLPQFVEYSDGELEAVAYERLPVAFIPILRDHEDKINALLKRKQSHKRKIKRNKIKYRRSVSL